MKMTHHGEKGFTMTELLIVAAILVIIAAVMIPNRATSMSMGPVSAANSEAENVNATSLAYYADTQVRPDTTSSTVTVGDTTYSFGDRHTGAVTASYSFDNDRFLADAGNPRGDDACGISTGYGSACFMPSSDMGHGKRVRDES